MRSTRGALRQHWRTRSTWEVWLQLFRRIRGSRSARTSSSLAAGLCRTDQAPACTYNRVYSRRWRLLLLLLRVRSRWRQIDPHT